MKCCEFEDRLKNSFANQASQLPRYSAMGPNSNTFILNVISGAGGSANLPLAAVHRGELNYVASH
jgi:hypothetical protein